MRVYQFAHSPFCIPILRMLNAAGVDFESVDVSPWDRGEVARVTKGEYYQVPVVVNGDDVVFESGDDTQDVARYVDRKFLSGPLFPVMLDGLQTILCRYLEDEVESVTFKLTDSRYIPAIEDVVARTMLKRHKERKFGRGCVEQWGRERENLQAALMRALAPIDSTLRYRRFLLSDDAPVFADFLLNGMVGNLTFRDYNQIPADLEAIRRHTTLLNDWRF